ncbi:hypothetical protein [Sphingomonas profundi]|nr:hypothetical protein [Sphingomonas profundi]
MAHERKGRGIGRREAIALAGLLAGMLSAALLTEAVRPPEAHRAI